MNLICIVLPSSNNGSPIKGAAALANELVKKTKLVIVSLKDSKDFNNLFHYKCEHLDLSKLSWIQKYLFLKKYLFNKKKIYNIKILSYCFSGDVFTSFFKNKYQISSYIRGDLYKVYRLDYGLVGILYAWIQYEALKRFDFLLGLSKVMVDKTEKLTNKKCFLIPNFINENQISKYRNSFAINSKDINLIYLGRLTKLKSVSSLIKALHNLQEEKI